MKQHWLQQKQSLSVPVVGVVVVVAMDVWGVWQCSETGCV